jgi:hypothetical protein
MSLNKHTNALRWGIIVSALIINSLILWNTYLFFTELKKSQLQDIQLWNAAQEEINNADVENDFNQLEIPLLIIQNADNTPLILVPSKGKIRARNIPEEIEKDSVKLQQLIIQLAQENEPIVSELDGKVLTTLYYGDSTILTKLKYYPLALVLILILFGAVIYFFYRSTKSSEQNKLWAGMAKESAHQIGTPLSSLVGWTVILRDTDVDPTYIDEMEKDVKRLQMITDRFSKIGSIPKLEKLDVVEQTVMATNYISSRSSKLINFEIDMPDQPIMVKINEQLFAWVIENLIKNGIDAMKGKGDITVFLKADVRNVYIRVTDTGKGIAKNQWNKIFTPGFTTKKRGWGLGLSLAKRIINDYHNGNIKVLESKKGTGTTFEIVMNRA